MTTLQLLRHGKSDWGAGNADHARPLAPRGRRAAASVGRFLTAAGRVPDLVLSSSAVRARSTAELASEAGGWGIEPVVLDDLYLPSVDAVLSAVARHGRDAGTVMVVGHEPTWSGLVGHLTSAVVRYPTAGLASIDLHVTRWADVELDTRGELELFLSPRVLDALHGSAGGGRG